MSALAKFYASRGIDLANDGLPARVNGMVSSSPSTTNLAVLRRKNEGEAKSTNSREFESNEKPTRKEETARSYTSALDVLESVNSGLVDVFDRLQKLEFVTRELKARTLILPKN